MKNRILIVFLAILVLGIILSFSLFQITGRAVYKEQTISKDYLESLRLQANLECLQNSQCSEGYECVENKCVDKKSINLCKDFSLSTATRRLEVGLPINYIKEIVTDSQFPYLLSDGLIVEEFDGKIIEHFYTQAILIGNNKLEKENQDYLIKIKDNPNEFIYRLTVTFSKGVDFSSKNIQGQVLRILGKEYVIGADSTNSVISLISEDKKIRLEDSKNVKIGGGLFPSVKATPVKIFKDSEGNVVRFDIMFNSQGEDKSNINVGENYADPVFDAFKLSFNNVRADNGFADIRVGGVC